MKEDLKQSIYRCIKKAALKPLYINSYLTSNIFLDL